MPKPYQRHVVELAHDSPLSGHFGTRKTTLRILEHFYWPGILLYVKRFCRTCHTCQRIGKPNQPIPRAYLQPIPAFDEPFGKIIIDVVGPLPKSKTGKEYLLTIMCSSTRFPEAIPLRSIPSKSVCEALTTSFTHFGYPHTIQSDRASNFTSNLFEQFTKQLGITHITSSAYHPESQGSLERFHQTLKTMIKNYCLQNQKDWVSGIPLLLYAARSSVQESLGFSPFQLIFGHEVRGPLKLFKEKMLSRSNQTQNILEYVQTFKQRLDDTFELARAYLVDTQTTMKKQYDKKAKYRSFQVGDQVLMFLPVPGKPLSAKYQGPYTIHRKSGDLNYIIRTPDRRKTFQHCHINMLKQYHSHDDTIVSDDLTDDLTDNTKPVLASSLVEAKTIYFESKEETNFPSPRLPNSVILSNIETKLNHLEIEQKEELSNLLSQYKDTVFSDKPGRTSDIKHDVDVGNARPIKQHHYRVGPDKRDILSKEIKDMLENDIIEPSYSPWSSPCILVPKADGTWRLVTDYRKVNELTKTDSFPISRIDDCIDQIGQSKYVTKLDCMRGYWQIELTDRAKEISAFATPDGVFSYKVTPFGMKNSGSTFQRLMNRVIFELDGTVVYIDDICVYSNHWRDHIKQLKALLERLKHFNLTITLAKSEFACATVTFLGHVIGQGQVLPINAKIAAILEFPIPVDVKSLQRLLGMVGYYRKFCRNFSTITAPLTNLLKKNKRFVWSDECQKAFENIKAILTNYPVLHAPDYSKPFKLTVDASDIGIGAVLAQENNGIDHPLPYFSKKLTSYQKNYATIEK